MAVAARPAHAGQMTDLTLAESRFSHVINAPIDRVDVADWLFNLPTADYRRCCPPAHIAAGTSTADDGRPMSINVETVGEILMIHQFAGEEVGPRDSRLVSRSTAIAPDGRTTLHVEWRLSVDPLAEGSCKYTNRVSTLATPEFLAFIERRGVSLEQARHACTQASAAHVRMETPLFADSLERHALTKLIAA